MTAELLAATDWSAAVDLVSAAGLPTADLRPGVQTFWGIRSVDRLVGVIAWERVGNDALVRSFAVAPEHRGRGLGTVLYRRLEAEARAHSVSRLVLLTETAQRFFLRQGFVATARDSVGPEIQATAEFTGLCPDSAVCLSLTLESFRRIS